MIESLQANSILNNVKYIFSFNHEMKSAEKAYKRLTMQQPVF